MYLRTAAGRSERGEAEYRRRLLEGLSGRVLELGAGSGLNFQYYPRGVEEIVAVEPEPSLRRAAIEAARKAPVPVTVTDGVAGELPVGDQTFDAAVASLVLCSVSDLPRALAELHRVVRPGGELRFYEHVVAHTAGARLLQQLADATLWPRIAGGCHLARDTGQAIERAGFKIEALQRFAYSPAPPVPRIPHILGIARRS